MAKDYILFIHGVNTREEREQPTYADNLFRLIQNYTSSGASSRTLVKVALYWGDVNKDKEQQLLKEYEDSPDWEKFWFKDFRAKQLLQFCGDAALYISRYAGARVVDRVKKQALVELSNYQPEDRLHLVGHSLGTVILFDVLFSTRWDAQDVPGHDSVMAIRQAIYGIAPNPQQGIHLASIHTMGSPIGLFSLMDVDKDNKQGESTHDITPRLADLLENLYKTLGCKIPWRNFAHPGDPIAAPLVPLLSNMVDTQRQFLDVQDVITHNTNLLDWLNQPVSQTLFALLHGGEAHSSYWQNHEVALRIAKTIQEAARPVGSIW